jgi:hypothetical protein
VALRACLLTVCLGGAALAQELPDAALPDASVDQGGADQTSEENDPTGPCLSAGDCDRGFACQSGRCVPAAVRDATSSCEVAGPGALAGLLVVAVRGLARRGRRSGAKALDPAGAREPLAARGRVTCSGLKAWWR